MTTEEPAAASPPSQEHLALRTSLGLEACCAVVQAALGAGPFQFDSEDETEWGEAAGPGGIMVNVSRPYRKGTLQRWDPSVPRGCNVGVTLWPAASLNVAELARALAEAFGAPVHHHRTWLGPGRNATFHQQFAPGSVAEQAP